MNSQDFLEKFKGLFEEEDVTKITIDSSFKTIDEWSSMTALYLIAMADEEYGVTITGTDIRSATTVKDIFDIVQLKAS